MNNTVQHSPNTQLIRDGLILTLGLLVTAAGFLGREISLVLAGA